jgi:hypothetical protein
MDNRTEVTTGHHAFTLSVGILTFALIVLNVTYASNHDPDPAQNQPQVVVFLENTLGIDNGSGTIVQSQEGESGGRFMETGQSIFP